MAVHRVWYGDIPRGTEKAICQKQEGLLTRAFSWRLRLSCRLQRIRPASLVAADAQTLGAPEGETVDRKALLRLYKETPRAAGLFAVRNTIDGVLLVGTSTDLPGMLNRQRFQLEMRSHPDKVLQADWERLGSDAFSFEVLEELKLPEERGYDLHDDLTALRDLWLEKLSAAGQVLYPSSSRGT